MLRLRKLELSKNPGLSELIDWVSYMQAVTTPEEELDTLPYIGVLAQTAQRPTAREKGVFQDKPQRCKGAKVINIFSLRLRVFAVQFMLDKPAPEFSLDIIQAVAPPPFSAESQRL